MDITSYLLGKQAGGGGGSATLQSKSVTITENGTTNVIPDTGYDGLTNVNITTNVGGDTPPDYISDGLIAWFDLTDLVDNDERWYNKVGNDYIYIKARKFGNSTTYPYTKISKEPFKNRGIFTFASSVDYYKEGYTIEIVGTSLGYNIGSNNTAYNGGWLVTGNINGSSGIGIKNTTSSGTKGYVNFINADTSYDSYSDFLIDIGKPFNASVYFSTLKERSFTTAYNPVVKASVNGSSYVTITSTRSEARSSRGNELLFLTYYEGNYLSHAEIKCIRIYNRELTEAEKNHNFEIDQTRFNIS